MKHNPRPPRPQASEAEIRAMRDQANTRQAEAEKYEAQARHEVAAAQKIADDMVANARAEAHRIVQQAQEQAAAHQRQADDHAKELRAQRDAEVARAEYWSGLAAEETERAGLTPVAATSAIETITDPAAAAQQNGVAR